MAAFVGQRWLMSSLGAFAFALSPLMACAQSPSSAADDESGLDFFRPPPNLFQLQQAYRTAPGNTRDVTTETLNLRYDHAFDLAPAWMLVSRTDLPLLARDA